MTRPAVFLLAALAARAAFAAEDPKAPPGGWAEARPAGRSFTVWLPDRPGRRSDRERNLTVRAMFMRISSIEFRTNDGLTLSASSIILPAQFLTGTRPQERLEVFRDADVEDVKGKVLSKEKSL